ncbi:type II secretory pathway, component PulF [Clostridium aceticum]|uniref:Type II secretory pathway, component PulF n=1 Tax=Clostridium aceticum TaxID=84022 RepID=A0A0D8I9B1_9CLOT|nr:type II secretion system F family protein [Clostridium aceticum]AKL96215.1 type II secretory pathway, component PulF [Clostridium aceticum]KJF26627.1 hypothetical protein TZ02_12205 [Clostridium aceticum]
MGLYYYKGKRTDRKKVSGLLAADSEKDLNKKLAKQCVKPSNIRYLVDLKGLEYYIFKPKEIKKLTKKQIADFFEQMYFTLDAGLSLGETVEALGESSDNTIAMLGTMLEPLIVSGISLTDALKKTGLFPKDIIIKVDAGTESAKISNAIKDIVDKLRQEIELTEKIKSAMSYPIMLVFLTIGVAIFLLTYIIPMLADVLNQFNSELPVITQMIISLSRGIQKYWWLIIAQIIILINIHIYLYRSKDSYRLKIDSWTYKIPVIGEIVFLNHLYTFNSTFHQLVNSGVNQDRALIIVKDIVSNVVMQQAIEEITDDIIREGSNIYEAMKKQEIIPSDYLKFISIGVKTGKLNEILGNISKKYKMDIENKLIKATKLIEPIAIVLIGIMIGVFVISMWMPLFAITESI